MTKAYEDLTFTDDFMFCKILESNPDLCKELLELILGRKLGEIVSINKQNPIEITADGKGVRFDIYVEAKSDKNGKREVYNVEMQNVDRDSLPKRTRYSQGLIDLNLLGRGMKYKDLNKSFVIYICNFNLKPKIGRHKYTFANLCREDPSIELGDETEKIFLCAKGTEDDVSEDMKAFLTYIAEGKTGNKFTEELENAVTEARLHKEWRLEYMTLLEHYEEEREKGREEERKNTEQERIRADKAEERAGKAEERADKAEERVRELEALLARE